MSVGRRLPQWLPFFAWLSVVGLAVASWTPGEDMIRTGVGGSFEHIAAYFISTLMLVCAYPGWPPWTIGGALAVYARILEIGQIYVPGRHSQLEDFAGSCLGLRSLSRRPYGFVERPRPCIKERKTRSGCGPAR
jgi:VanZ family protein